MYNTAIHSESDQKICESKIMLSGFSSVLCIFSVSALFKFTDMYENGIFNQVNAHKIERRHV